MAGTGDLTRLLVAIADLDHRAAVDLLNATPSLATAMLARRDEFFLAERLAQVYEGDTALHAAGFSYDRRMARGLITRGADIRARNRRGAEPLREAVIGAPGSASWTPNGVIRLTSAMSFCISSRPALIQTQPPPAVRHLCIELSETDVRLLSRPSCARVPILASKTTTARPRPTSLARQPVAVARARQRLRPNKRSLSNCSRSAPRETLLGSSYASPRRQHAPVRWVR